jgi:hypothetical protein
MAYLDFEKYQNEFLRKMKDITYDDYPKLEVYSDFAKHTYSLDDIDVACFKYFFNFVLDRNVRDQVAKALFEEHITDEASFAEKLYMNWEEARQMQTAGMVIGGHSNRHQPLATLSPEVSWRDLQTCQSLLAAHVQPQRLWPFSYPYGQKNSFNDTTIEQLKQLGFACAFSTEVAANVPGINPFIINRTDCTKAPRTLQQG